VIELEAKGTKQNLSADSVTTKTKIDLSVFFQDSAKT
jgi:hypothetical protein